MITVNARSVAYAALTERVEGWPQLHRLELDLSGLSPRDARLAMAIDHQATMRWLTLRALIEPHLKQHWEGLKPIVRGALLGGAAQLLLMDRVPDHAVLNETVELIKSSSQPRAAGLVNAILRRLCDLRGDKIESPEPDGRDILLRSDGTGTRLNRPILAEDADRRWQQQTSCPASLFEDWVHVFGRDQARQLALHGIVEAPLIVSGEFDEAVLEKTQPHSIPGFRVVEPGHPAGELLEAHPGLVVQDPASAEPIRCTIGLKPRIILDLCAGRGTKTRLLARQHPEARIIATDIDRKIIGDLKRSTADCGNVEVRPYGQHDDLLEAVDLLVLDVPCSNTAVLARRTEARYRSTVEAVEELAGRQRQIMADALPVVGLNGHILYATCSLDPTENEEQAKWLTHWHRFGIVHEHLMLPKGLPGDSPADYHDGSYHVLLKR